MKFSYLLVTSAAIFATQSLVSQETTTPAKTSRWANIFTHHHTAKAKGPSSSEGELTSKLASIYEQKSKLHTQLAELNQELERTAINPSTQKSAAREARKDTIYAKINDLQAQIHTTLGKRGGKQSPELKSLHDQLRAARAELRGGNPAKRGSHKSRHHHKNKRKGAMNNKTILPITATA